jgi:hypothetical protein
VPVQSGTFSAADTTVDPITRVSYALGHGVAPQSLLGRSIPVFYVLFYRSV